MNGLKKRLCNPPAVLVAAMGDPELQGLFEGAGDGLAFVLETGEEAYAPAAKAFEKTVVSIERNYILARKKLAADTTAEMKKAVDELVRATGGEVYGGG